MKKLLSIIVATKNREYYCIETIKTILSINSDEFQLTISDNSDSVKVKDFVATLNDDRLKYKYDNSAKSSIDNFNECMALATGEYVCMIGDDDGVLPEIIDIIKWAKLNDVDSISSNSLIQYYWPKGFKNIEDGILIYPLNKNKINLFNPLETIEKLIKNGIVNHFSYSIPRTYHGIVKRSLMDQIKSITGTYYGGLSPDIYSSFALSSLVKKHYEFTLPFTIAGVCPKSTTADNLIGRHSGSLKDMPHLKNRGIYLWDENVPKYYSVYTTWCESALKALLDMNQISLYNKFNKFPLLALGILTNFKYIFKLTLIETENLRISKKAFFIPFWLKILFNMPLQSLVRIKRTLIDKFYLKKVKKSNVNHINQVISIISNVKIYSERNLS